MKATRTKKRRLKKPVSYRISPEGADLVRVVAAETGRSEGDIVDQCICSMAETVLITLQRRREILGSPSVIAGMSQEVLAAAPLPTSRPARPNKLSKRKEGRVPGGAQ